MRDFYERIRAKLLTLPGVVEGTRFGGPAFFYGKRFFCHCHVGSTQLSLEAYVFDKMEEVMKRIPGVIPHPEYSAFGWVRLSVRTHQDMEKAFSLLELAHRYLRTIKRISLPKGEENLALSKRVIKQLKGVTIRMRESPKRINLMIEADSSSSVEEAEKRLEEIVRKIRTLIRPGS